MGPSAGEWRQRVGAHFSFLEEHGFHKPTADDSSWWATIAQYSSDRSAVRVSRSVEFQRSEVHLIRLVDGTVPPYPIWVTSAPIDWTLLDNVLIARAPELYRVGALLKGLSDDDVERQLAFWASALRSVAPEFLEGDLTLFADAEEVIRARLQTAPQQLTVSIPDDAPAGAEEAEMRDAAKTVPPEVKIVVRRYRRSANPDR